MRAPFFGTLIFSSVYIYFIALITATMSAESKVNPGGYHTYPQALEQFTVSDERTAKEIEQRLKQLGREPVWKDWDAAFDYVNEKPGR